MGIRKIIRRKWWNTYLVVLDADLPEHGLLKGDIGTVVKVYPSNDRFDVEFTTLKGEAIATVTLEKDQVREARDGEVARARTIFNKL